MSDKLGKYHDEAMGSSSGGPQDSSNESTLPPRSGGMNKMLMPENSGNPMMNMSGGKGADGMSTNMGNPMMPMSGPADSSLPSMEQVMETNPQGKKQAPLAGKLYQAESAHVSAAKK